MSASAENGETSHRKTFKNKQNRQNNNHVLSKRTPQKFQKCDSVIYVNNKTHLKALFEKCEKLINKQENEITLYCLGAAIQKGINLALQVCEKYPTFNLCVNTLTTDLVDDLVPIDDDFDYEIQKRQNSALQIQLFRTNPITDKHPVHSLV